LAGIGVILAFLSPFVSNMLNFAGVLAGLSFLVPFPSILIALIYLALGKEQPKVLLLTIFTVGSGLMAAIILVGLFASLSRI
jgi:hypothetical protein